MTGFTKTCQWCGAPATDTVTLEPTRYRTVTETDPQTREKTRHQVVAQFAIVADVCDQHRNVADREGGAPIPDLRRRGAKGVEQTSIFDVLGDADAGPRNAILGSDA